MYLTEGQLPESSVRILVADDSPIFRQLVEHTLAGSRYSLVFAKSGRELIDLLARHAPTLVIMDWMPDLGVIEICQHIRSRPQTSYTYIILLTGKSEKENVVVGLEAGADDYLTKPFNPDELVARVRAGLRITELHRRVEAQNSLLQELALTDPLTGLPNRRAVEDWANRQLSGAARHRFPFWLAMADLDHFKLINDTYGHGAGDAVLKKFSEVLKANTRGSDMCCRLGGEEFLFVVTHANNENAKGVIERIRTQFAATQFRFNDREVSVTASFGVACYGGSQKPEFNRLLASADAALYSAKHRGRNCIEMAAQVTS